MIMSVPVLVYAYAFVGSSDIRCHHVERVFAGSCPRPTQSEVVGLIIW
jgi:hypothetical protein